MSLYQLHTSFAERKLDSYNRFPARIGNLNPALGFAFQLFESVRNSDASLMYYSLIGLIVPFIGAVIAAVLF